MFQPPPAAEGVSLMKIRNPTLKELKFPLLPNRYETWILALGQTASGHLWSIASTQPYGADCAEAKKFVWLKAP
jgi:hypothetical protein